MNRSKASGYELDRDSARIVLGMVARGDRHHDIASWFGVNQGRIKDAQDGKYGTLEAASARELPPKGAPGIKGRKLRQVAQSALSSLSAGNMKQAQEILNRGIGEYDANED
jgi:hypothetical protein